MLFLIHLERFSDDLQAYELSSHFHRHHLVLIENVVALFRSNEKKIIIFENKRLSIESTLASKVRFSALGIRGARAVPSPLNSSSSKLLLITSFSETIKCVRDVRWYLSENNKTP